MRTTVSSAVDDVQSYYDQNTARFERFGQGRGTGAIHRAVRPEPGDDDPSPFRTLERLVLRRLARLEIGGAAPHVLDLGCGVGASMLYLAEQAPITATGITLSGLQAERARARIAARGLAERVRCVQGSYLEVPADVPPAALAYSIEAFIHGPDPRAFFAAAARHVVPGGVLMIFDDFLTEHGKNGVARRDLRVLTDVRRGWLANTLVTPGDATALAREAGFELESDVDLTARLELRRPRDRAISLLVALGRHLPFGGFRFRSLIGGDALQHALTGGLMSFRAVTWRLA
jgi:SAM-dependent methyltransferase